MSRNKFPEVTVKRILDSAESLFIKKGYDNTTIQDIVDDLGDLSKGAIYHHFKGKEEIMKAVTDRRYAFDFEEFVRNEKTGLMKLRKLAMYCLVDANQKEFFECAPDYLKDSKIFAAQFNSMHEEIIPAIMPFIREGIEDGSIKSEYPEEIGEIFLTLINFWVNPAVLPCDYEKTKRKLDFLGDIFDYAGLPLMDDEVKEALLSYVYII